MYDLKARRKELGLTMLEVANAIGVSEGTISRYESGNIKNMKRNIIGSYAKVLGISPVILMGINERDTTPCVPDEMIPIPVVGSAAAGYTCLAQMDIESYECVCSGALISGYDYVYLRVKGDSMESLLLENDFVLVRIQDSVESGDYAVVVIDNENGLVKKVEISGNEITLISNNPYYPPRKFKGKDLSRIKIFGKVIESKRKF